MPVPRLILLITLAVASLVPGFSVAPASAQEAVFIVRHAERLDSSADSPLSEAGQARAARLAQMVRDARITMIVATEFQRTQATARPLSDLLKLPVKQIAAADLGGLLTALRAAGPHGRVLVVSHGDRAPAILAALGDKQDVAIASNEYDNLWMVVAGAGGAPVIVRLRY